MSKTKTTTRFRVGVHAVSDHLDDHPEEVSVTLSRRDAARILYLAKEVKRLGLYKVVEWDGTPNWEKDGFQPECQALNVTEEYFYYDCFPKHCNIAVETNTIDLKKLRERFPGIRVRR